MEFSLSAELLQVTLGDQSFHISLPDVELRVLGEIDRPVQQSVKHPATSFTASY